MKLKYLFIALASSLFMFAACEKEEATSLDSIKLACRLSSQALRRGNRLPRLSI